jgi:hypothetical protein
MTDELSKFMQFLASSPWLTLSGWVIGLISLLAAFRRRKSKLPMFAIESRVVFDNLSRVHHDLSIRFRDQPVSDLGLTTVYIWNDGREAVRREDIQRMIRCESQSRLTRRSYMRRLQSKREKRVDFLLVR